METALHSEHTTSDLNVPRKALWISFDGSKPPSLHPSLPPSLPSPRARLVKGDKRVPIGFGLIGEEVLEEGMEEGREGGRARSVWRASRRAIRNSCASCCSYPARCSAEAKDHMACIKR